MWISRAARDIITEDTRRFNRQRIQYLSAVIDGIGLEVRATVGLDTHPSDTEQLTQELISSAISMVAELSDAQISQAVQLAEEEVHLQMLAREDELEGNDEE